MGSFPEKQAETKTARLKDRPVGSHPPKRERAAGMGSEKSGTFKLLNTLIKKYIT